MEPIYDHSGAVVAWRKAEGIYALDGQACALLWNRGIHDLQGRYLGRFEDGWFRDRSGRVVAFIQGATGGPLPPSTQAPPVAPRHVLARLPEIFETAPAAPFRSTRWSDGTWSDLLATSSEGAAAR